MEILRLKTFMQPDSNTRIVIRELGTLFYPPYSCQRLVSGQVQQGVYGVSKERIDELMSEWEQFEQHIHSTEL